MDVATLLTSLLTAGAALMAEGAAGEFAKGAGKTAFEALKSRLTTTHGAGSMVLLDRVRTEPSFAPAIQADLARVEIARDGEVLALAEQLRSAIAALPEQVTTAYAIDIAEIRAGANLLVDTAQGIRANLATAVGDITFRNVAAPPGKP